MDESLCRWISVKERMPENEKDVLISFDREYNGKVYHCVGMAFHTDGMTTTDDSIYCWNENDDLIVDEERDAYIVPQGWWEVVNFSDEFSAVNMPVTHWMPLPSAPNADE